MRILVPLKRVPDPDNANRVFPSADGTQVDLKGLAWKQNPFDEYALEAALRLTEDGRAPKVRLGEVIVTTVGPSEAEPQLRTALATGADRAIRFDAWESDLDVPQVAACLAAAVQNETPDLVLLGKQSVDGEASEVPGRLAEALGWPLVSAATAIIEEAEGVLIVDRESDAGLQQLRVQLPAVVSVDLRIVGAAGVRSRHTPAEFAHRDGVRFAALPAIMQAKRKPLAVQPLPPSLPAAAITYVAYERPPARPAGRRVASVDELVQLLTDEAKVL